MSKAYKAKSLARRHIVAKYDPLKQYLTNQKNDEIPMDFKDIERVIGATLPASSRDREWWENDVSGSHVQAQSWRGAGYSVDRINIELEKVIFRRVRGADTSDKQRSQRSAMD
jgi:hypothetical protein